VQERQPYETGQKETQTAFSSAEAALTGFMHYSRFAPDQEDLIRASCHGLALLKHSYSLKKFSHYSLKNLLLIYLFTHTNSQPFHTSDGQTLGSHSNVSASVASGSIFFWLSSFDFPLLIFNPLLFLTHPSVTVP
jgi:hypothetical protein